MLRRLSFLTVTLTLFFTVPSGAEPFLNNFSAGFQDSDPYLAPTKRFLAKYDYKTIEYDLYKQKSFRIKQKKFYDSVIDQEERGAIGYNASNHEFRIFQDIVRITLEEHLGLEFKKDFHFFRVPGDPSIMDLDSALAFLKKFPDINDNITEQRNQVVSANFALYGNFDEIYECTIYYFETAYSYKPPDFTGRVGFLFDQLGIKRGDRRKPDRYINELFEIGNTIKHKNGGALFQFFDLSHQTPQTSNPYSLLDRLCYPAKKKGVQVPFSGPLSSLFIGTDPTRFLDQFRVVINHFDMLNPYGPFAIRRYDLNDPKVVKEYERKLRDKIRSMAPDVIKASLYKKQLKTYWNFDE